MKLAIIGCGYVGSAVARLWHQSGHEVTVTTTTPAKKQELQTIATNVALVSENDLAGLQRAIRNCDVVLLSVGSKQRTPQAYRLAYLETARNVVRAIGATPGVKQLIYTGSYGMLKENSGATIDETVEVEPQDEYGEILHQTEQELLSMQSQTSVCILRLAGIYGSGRELIKIFGRSSGTTRPGRGEEYTNWVNLEDIVRAIDFARIKQLQGIYHLNSDEILTIKEFLDRLFKAHNLPTVTWDSSQPSTRAFNLKLANQKLKNAGFELVHPQIKFK